MTAGPAADHVNEIESPAKHLKENFKDFLVKYIFTDDDKTVFEHDLILKMIKNIKR